MPIDAYAPLQQLKTLLQSTDWGPELEAVYEGLLKDPLSRILSGSDGPVILKELLKIEQYLRERLESLLAPSVEAEGVGVVINIWIALLEALPTSHLSERPSQPAVTPLVVEIDDDLMEPVGSKILLTAALIEDLPQRDRVMKAVGKGVVYFLEELRTELLPRWKRFHESQTKNADFTRDVPSTEQRLVEAWRLQNLFLMVEGDPLAERWVDRLLPCVLYMLDDFSSPIAVAGVQTVGYILDRASPECCQNWAEVLKKALTDRLMSSDLALWTELLPVVCSFGDQFLEAQIPILAQILERLQTDLAPYELTEVALGCLCDLVVAIGRPVVQFFSKLFPLMTGWLLSSQESLQTGALELMKAVMKAGSERLPCHQDIILEILSTTECRLDSQSALRTQIEAAKRCLNELC